MDGWDPGYDPRFEDDDDDDKLYPSTYSEMKNQNFPIIKLVFYLTPIGWAFIAFTLILSALQFIDLFRARDDALETERGRDKPIKKIVNASHDHAYFNDGTKGPAPNESYTPVQRLGASARQDWGADPTDSPRDAFAWGIFVIGLLLTGVTLTLLFIYG